MQERFLERKERVHSAECDENVRNSLFSSEQMTGGGEKNGDDLSTIALRIAALKVLLCALR
jgi:hypothetical protein